RQPTGKLRLVTTKRVTERVPCALETFMENDKKVKGPTSYFPSIENTYGQPVSHWFAILDSLKDQKHMEQVAHLKSTHKIGHGHANALVAYHRAQFES